MQLDHFIELDPALTTYSDDLASAVAKIGSADVDVVVIHDYDHLCIDFPGEAARMSWTPNGLFLVVCDKKVEVQEAMGSALYYAGSYSEWDGSSSAASGISGYTSMQFTSMFEKEFNVAPDHFAASAFAGAEILVSAIEQQAVSDISKVLDTVTISDRILAGSWPTIKSAAALTFSSLRQAVGPYVSLQYNSAGVAVVVSGNDNFLYPMPSFESREAATDDASSGGGVTNNYYGDDNCDESEWAVALVLTGVFCLLGGIAIGAGLFSYVMKSTVGVVGGASPAAVTGHSSSAKTVLRTKDMGDSAL
eukprot:CAMPEP_0114439038 /NCGR_PEP_ID=MMETSP0103-20121206/14972_1 /TAXON_ID=37642 ORGANISM="Paraphysomonas imperforata, Strain PA2" /NCGR_SAMPLE_ID=MMETSP0103 /ASSEMBLY_ACC=CAM_ASM_000201 /LENGTH=305 /DNA_ID=CAMNT_0001609747 /DNA_START=27 /DNA_END=944 /DNA_ORIENTATION=-